jgi:hypothetical protein
LEYSRLKFLTKLLSKFLIRIGITGQADVNGILGKKVTLLSGQSITLGIRVEIEIKTGNARQSTEQKRWQKMIESLGGIYIVARSEQEAINKLKDRLNDIR